MKNIEKLENFLYELCMFHSGVRAFEIALFEAGKGRESEGTNLHVLAFIKEVVAKLTPPKDEKNQRYDASKCPVGFTEFDGMTCISLIEEILRLREMLKNTKELLSNFQAVR